MKYQKLTIGRRTYKAYTHNGVTVLVSTEQQAHTVQALNIWKFLNLEDLA